MEKLKPRKLYYDTQISKSVNVTVIAPECEYGIQAAQKVCGELQRYCEPSLLINPHKNVMYSGQGPIILIGNLSDSHCIKDLYYKFLAVTDLHYPGPGGYEVRTLIDPLGTGYNIIQIGYSDEDGLNKAIDIFCSGVMKDKIRYFCELKPVKLHFPPGKVQELFCNTYSLDDPTIFHTAPIDEKGYLAYLTGDKELLKVYCDSLRALFKLQYNHLKLNKRVVAWRLLEVTGMLPEDIRADILNFLYNWADGPEGIGSIMESTYQSPDFPRQNHGLLPAIALMYLHDYFAKYYPELKRPIEWKKYADIVHSVYFNGSWKPLCDGLCHGWWMAQPAMLEYSLFDDEHKYFNNGGARKAALCAMAVVNNEGWLPNAGDCGITRQFPGFTLDISSEHYRDGKYKYISNMAPIWRRGYSGPYTVLPRMFDAGIAPKMPEELIGATVIPMDPIVYNAWEKNPDIAHLAADAPPTAPIEKCFDKLAIRTGFSSDDEFLLIDGLGGGSHSYADAMGILDYQKYGVSFIVSEDQLYWIEPDNHSMLTIYKDGKAKTIPAFPELEKLHKYEDGRIYVSTLLKGCDGTDWRREIYFVPDKCLVFNDTVIAHEEGDYSIEAHFRTPGRADLFEDGMQSERKTREDERVSFTLKTICSSKVNCSIKEIPLNYSYRTLPGEMKPASPEIDPVEFAKIRYHLDHEDIVLSAFTAKTSVKMKPGDKVSFTSVAYAQKTHETLSINCDNEKISVLIGNESIETVFEGYKADNEANAQNDSISYIKNMLDLSGAISSYKTVDSKLWCGMSDGRLICIEDKENHFSVIADFHERINDFIHYDGFIYAGCGDNLLCKITPDGEVIWKVETVRIPTMFPWWELDTPSVNALQVGRFFGQDVLIAGCGDNNVKFYSLDGQFINSYYFYAAVPNLLKLFDVNGDGKDELLAAGNIITCASIVDVVNDEGKLIHRFGNEGWTSIATVMECFEIAGRKAVALGVNHRKNLKLYMFDNDSESIKGEYVIDDMLAGAVTGIDILQDADMLAAGTSQGFVVSYGLDGVQKWVRSINGVICDVKAFKGAFWAAEKSGYIYIYDSLGALVKTLYAGESLKGLKVVGDTMWAVTKGTTGAIEFER